MSERPGRRPPAGVVLLLTFARRGEEAAISAALEHLRRALPDGRIAAVATPASSSVLRGLGVSDLIVYGEERTVRQVVAEMRARAPWAAAIIYSGPVLSGHLKLELLALSAGARRIYRFLPEEAPRVAGRLRLLASVAAKLVRAAGCFAVSAAICAAALCCLRVRQAISGGPRASRA